MTYFISNGISPTAAIVKRIDLIRSQNNLNQEQLAKLLSISQSAVSKYLKQRIPPADILLKLARLGRTTIEWILTGEKQHFYSVELDRVMEEKQEYKADVDIQLAKNIAGLGVDAKKVLIHLIKLLGS